MVAALDDFNEERGAVLDGLCEDLQKITFLIVVNKDLFVLQHSDIFLHLEVDLSEALPQVVVIGVRNFIQELDAACLHSLDCRNDVVRAQSDVLYSGTAVVLAELLNLTLADAVGGLVDGHLDALIEVGHHDGAEGRELGVDHLVVDGPEAVEVEHLLVPLGDGLHLSVLLVSHAMINVEEFGHWHEAVESLGEGVCVVAWHEDASVAGALDEGVDGVTVGLHGRDDDSAIFVLECGGCLHTCGSLLDGLVVDCRGVIYCKGDVLDAVTVLCVMSGELGVVGLERGSEDEGDVVVADDVGAEFTLSSLKAL